MSVRLIILTETEKFDHCRVTEALELGFEHASDTFLTGKFACYSVSLSPGPNHKCGCV